MDAIRDESLRMVHAGVDRVVYWLHCLWMHPLLQIIRKFMVTMIVLVITFQIMMFMAVLVYTLVYNMWVPITTMSWPLYFNFPEPDVDGLGAHPITHVPLLDPNGENALTRSTGYDLIVELEMPSSPINRACGMFMVSLTLSGSRETAISQPAKALQAVTTQAVDRGLEQVVVTRPALMPYTSTPIWLVRATVLAVPLAMGLLGEKEILRVPLIEEVFDRANKPLTWATVELSDPRLEVYSAKLTANARLRGFSYYMHHWFFTSFIMGVYITALILMCSCITCTGCCFRRSLAEYYALEPPPPPPPSIAPVAPITRPPIVLPRRAKLRRRQLVQDPDLDMDVFSKQDVPADAQPEEQLPTFGEEGAEGMADDADSDLLDAGEAAEAFGQGGTAGAAAADFDFEEPDFGPGEAGSPVASAAGASAAAGSAAARRSGRLPGAAAARPVRQQAPRAHVAAEGAAVGAHDMAVGQPPGNEEAEDDDVGNGHDLEIEEDIVVPAGVQAGVVYGVMPAAELGASGLRHRHVAAEEEGKESGAGDS